MTVELADQRLCPPEQNLAEPAPLSDFGQTEAGYSHQSEASFTTIPESIGESRMFTTDSGVNGLTLSERESALSLGPA
jgi:hypothetical protein